METRTMTKALGITVRLIDAMGRTLMAPIDNRGIRQANVGDRVTLTMIERLVQMGVETVTIAPLTSKDFRITSVKRGGKWHFHASLVVAFGPAEQVRPLGWFHMDSKRACGGKFLWHAPSDRLDIEWARAVGQLQAQQRAQLAQWRCASRVA